MIIMIILNTFNHFCSTIFGKTWKVFRVGPLNIKTFLRASVDPTANLSLDFWYY